MKIKSELNYYKELAMAIPTEHLFLCPNSSNYSSLAYLTNNKNNSKTKKHLHDYNEFHR